MPAYGATGWPKAIYPGDVEQLINAADATAGNVTNTVAIALASIDGGNRSILFVNTTNHDGTIQSATADATGNYKSTSYVVSAGTSMPFNIVGPFVRINFASAPTSGTFSVGG